MRLFQIILSAMIVLFPAAALSQAIVFDPRSWKDAQEGPITQILTIGSTHLAQLERKPADGDLDDVLAKLAKFKPDIITHEGISGDQCEHLRAFKARYPDMWSTYCWGTDDVEMATGLTVAAALAEIDRTLASWPKTPTAVQRRGLIRLFLAANDRPSAYVQWLQLAPAERKEGDGIDATLLKIMVEAAGKRNETYMIASKLAAMMGLQRVYAVDDHTADSIDGLAGPGYMPAIRAMWKRPNTPEIEAKFAEYEKLQNAATTAPAMLDFYRALNSPAMQIAFVNGDFRKALQDKTPELYGRQYVAWYETRNLRMVANIRAAFANQPGAHVLNVVGASHKAYYDAYLNMMSDVKIVDAAEILK